MLKTQKVEYVSKLKKELKGYKVFAIMPIGSVPDRLVQRVRNQLKPDSKVIVARKNLLMRAISDDPELKRLEKYIEGDVALVLTKKEPLELHKVVSLNRMKLAAKPNQISPNDIFIESGETTIAPGQAVTDLKAAGIDVQIQKGKVVIGKSKVLVKKGAKITTAVSKALKMLDIMPFEAGTTLNAVLDGKLIYTGEALSINEAYIHAEITRIFREGYELSIAINMVTPYNVDTFIKKAYLGALGVGLEAEIYEPEVVEKLIAQAVREALSMPQPKKEEPAPATETPAAPAPTG